MRRYYSIAAAAWLVIATLAFAACVPQALPAAQQNMPVPTHAAATPVAATEAGSETTPPTRVPAAEAAAPTATPAPNTFIETFDGSPAHPQPWHPANWDVTVHSRDIETWDTLQPMDAMHGSDCAGPPATHPISSYEDALFLCRDHLMTSILAEGYGLIDPVTR